MKPSGDASQCEHIHCIMCADEAVTARVIALLPDNLVRAEVHGKFEIVSVMAVDAVEGDLLLVHAGEAISKVEE
jgi:hydrogenase expression/formation protein HypC